MMAHPGKGRRDTFDSPKRPVVERLHGSEISAAEPWAYQPRYADMYRTQFSLIDIVQQLEYLSSRRRTAT